MNPLQQGSAESESDFASDAAGLQQRWSMEFAAARKETKKWHKQGERIVKRYLDERDGRSESDTRWNLFASNVETLEALLYGKTPSVDVTRRFADSQDDNARVASLMLERLLNGDLERDNDGYSSALEYALQDRLLPGLGNVRLRYVVEMEQAPGTPAQTRPQLDQLGQPVMGADGLPATEELAPAIPPHEVKAHEDVETDYVHWRDQLWSPARTFHQVRWWAFKAQLSRDEAVKRFGKALGSRIPLNSKRGGADSDAVDAEKADPWGRADVWEIWDREHKTVYWYVDSFDRILDSKPDPLGLEGFWPFPRPMMANASTSKLLPRPDFVLAQDLYDEIDAICTRITVLERTIKVAGVYDKSAAGITRLLTEACQNELIPIENWAMFAEKGGVKGQIDFLPLDQIVLALGALREYRTELINALYQVTGMSDIMRGEAAQTATATEQAIKARFGSVRVQRRQDEFARFASDVQRIRGEIICKHFDAETILERSNIGNTPDAHLAQQAVQFLQGDFACYRIQVKPESVSLTDYAALKQERTDVISSIGGYLQTIGPLAQQMPGSATYLLQILQWMVSGLRGAGSIEGVLEQAITAAKLAQQQQAAQAQQQGPPPPPPPDPKIVGAQIKAQGDVQKTQAATQGRLVEINAETKAGMQQRAVDAHFTMMEDEAKDRREALRSVAAITSPGGTI